MNRKRASKIQAQDSGMLQRVKFEQLPTFRKILVHPSSRSGILITPQYPYSFSVT